MGLLSNFFKKKTSTDKQVSINMQSEKGEIHTKSFKVAGVTYGDRQKYLKQLLSDKLNGKIINVGVCEYDFNGHKALKVIANGKEIGSLHTDDTNMIFEDTSRVVGVKDLYINSFEDENDKTVYYAKLKLILKNKNQK